MSPLSPFFFFLFLSTLPKITQPYNSNTSALIYKTCKTSSLQDPNISFNFCLTSLQAAAHRSHGRHTDLRRLGLLSLRLVRRNVTSTRHRIKKLLRRKGHKRLDPFVKSCLDDCLELYSDAIPTLKRARRDYRAARYAEANSAVSSVMDDCSTCEDGFMEEKVVSPLTSRNHNAFELSAIALSIINMLA